MACWLFLSHLKSQLSPWHQDLVMIKLMFRYISINIPRQIIIWFRSQHQPIRSYCLSFWPIIAERVFCLLLPVEYARCCLSITLLSFCDFSSQSEASMRMFWPMGGLGSLPCNPWQPLYTQLVIKFSWWIEKWEKTYGGRIKCRKIFILQDKYFLVLIFRFYCGSDPHFAEIWGNKNPSLFDVSSLKLNILSFTTYSTCDAASFQNLISKQRDHQSLSWQRRLHRY